MSLREALSRPLLQMHASPACNLRCSYCTQGLVLTHKVTDDAFADPDALRAIAQTPPAHLYLSGGEPLIHPGVQRFVSQAIDAGHIVSFDTNLMVSPAKLEGLLGAWPADGLGFINVSHHLEQNVRLEHLLPRALRIAERGVGVFVKHIGLPEHLAQLPALGEQLFRNRIGWMPTLLYGPWHGRRFPTGYTDAEARDLLDMVTLGANALQVFEGVKTRGLPCAAGGALAVFNMSGRRELLRCCHGSTREQAWGRRGFPLNTEAPPTPCEFDACLGTEHFAFGVNAIAPEIDRFVDLCHGRAQPLGYTAAMQFITAVVDRGYRLVDQQRFDRLSGRTPEGVPEKAQREAHTQQHPAPVSLPILESAA